MYQQNVYTLYNGVREILQEIMASQNSTICIHTNSNQCRIFFHKSKSELPSYDLTFPNFRAIVSEPSITVHLACGMTFQNTSDNLPLPSFKRALKIHLYKSLL